MTLQKPRLDDRSFQQIVDEAKKRIPHYTKEWTDHNVSDPGVTLIELFAWMTETILYRLNQVPDLHTIKFMEMLGIKLLEPVPANAPITFWLSAAQETAVVIPNGTEVASTQTETKGSIVFTTDDDLTITPPAVEAVVSRLRGDGAGTKRYREHNLRRLQTGFEGADIFTAVPEVDDALYFGFSNDMSNHVLAFDFDFDSAGGAGVDPTLPPYVWEASTGSREDRWETCDVEKDTTNALNTGGRIQIHTPKMGLYRVNNEKLYWVRVRIQRIRSADRERGMRPYKVTPRIRQVLVSAMGGATEATHSQVIKHEFLGRSDGSPGQRFRLQRTPVLKRMKGESLHVHAENEPVQAWAEVNDFADSGFTDQHYTLDSVTGELRLGPAIRQPDGTIKLYGAIPPRGSNLIFQQYRRGGGTDGNVRAGVLNTLKTAIPFIARVSNRQPANGGLDAEALDAAMIRAPKVLRSRERAVTESDYEFLAERALPEQISRVRCLQPRPSDAGRVQPGQVYVLVIPRIPEPGRFLSAEELTLPDEATDRLTAYLDERRLLTVRLSVREPTYRGVAVKVQLRAIPGADEEVVEQDILSRLYTYLNPLTGGNDGKGWPFGRDIFISDVYQCLQGVAGVQFIRGVEMFASRVGGSADGSAVESLEVVEHGVVASGIHEVEFV